jgi:hypothetical protein
MNRLAIRFCRWAVLPTLIGTLSLARVSAAADSSSAAGETPTVIKLGLHPAPAAQAALRYRLMPHFIEQTPGNAAVQYMRAALAWAENKDYRDVAERIPDWLELSLEQLRHHDDVQKFFNNTPSMFFDLIGFAARKEYCEWDLPLREYNVGTRIPELQWLRELARLMALKARIEMSRGQFSEAIETIKTGLAIGRHAAEGPTLVNGLVGVAIDGLMLQQIQTLVQQPDCPNLYWALTALPVPCIDLRRADEMEQDNLYTILPELRDVREKSRSEEQWNNLLSKVTQKLIALQPIEKLSDGLSTKNVLAAATAYPKAKRQLHDFGYSAATIDSMPIAQAILTATVETYEHERDSLHRWFYLPYTEAWPALDDEEHRVANTDEIIPFGKLLLPSLRNVRAAQARLDREVAALRVLEALRLYAADHRGQLPKQLAEITQVPMPNDPITGKPFDYELRDGHAVLINSPAPPHAPVEHELHWKIEMAESK